MLQNYNHLHSALLSAHETSAHETSILFSEFHTNRLRYYNDEGKRRRKPSDSLSIREQLIDTLRQQYGVIRIIKVKDTGTLFIARVKTFNGRTIHRTAYSLPILAELLCEGLSSLPA